MLNQSITVMGMLIAMIGIFLAYREGIKTGLSMREGKVPPITPKAIKIEQKEIESEQEYKQKEVDFNEELLRDVNEAMDISRLYEGGDRK